MHKAVDGWGRWAVIPYRYKQKRRRMRMENFAIALTGRNSVMDWGLWLILIALVALYLWLAFRRRK